MFGFDDVFSTPKKYRKLTTFVTEVKRHHSCTWKCQLLAWQYIVIHIWTNHFTLSWPFSHQNEQKHVDCIITSTTLRSSLPIEIVFSSITTKQKLQTPSDWNQNTSNSSWLFWINRIRCACLTHSSNKVRSTYKKIKFHEPYTTYCDLAPSINEWINDRIETAQLNYTKTSEFLFFSVNIAVFYLIIFKIFPSFENAA